MKWILLFALSACVAQEPTVKDAAHELGVGTCSRFLACGWDSDTDRFDLCVKSVEEFICQNYDCDAAYPNYDGLVECTQWYSQLECSAVVHVCVL